MNERIRELAEQAGITVNAESTKFAELIVQECLKICDNSGRIGAGNDISRTFKIYRPEPPVVSWPEGWLKK